MAELLITDTNILIDYYISDPILIEILCKEFEVKISKVVMDEIEQFTYAEAIAFGIEIIDTEIEKENLEGVPFGLSFEDKSCIQLVHNLKASCLTNDKKLKTYLESIGCKTYWGLEMILLFVSKNHLTKEKASEIANRIFDSNFWYKEEVKNDFWDKLDGI